MVTLVESNVRKIFCTNDTDHLEIDKTFSTDHDVALIDWLNEFITSQKNGSLIVEILL